jgi:Arc/MetJ-type ribon-helix-helix transcriptional regulator
MKSNTKSSITLPAEELRLVNGLVKRLGARSKVEVVRRGLRLLKETTDREALRTAYVQAARQVRKSTLVEVRELDPLAGEGLEDES